MDDLISRQAAIDALTSEIEHNPPIDCIDSAFIRGVKVARRIINDLPAAEPNHDGFLEFLFNVINPNEMEQYMSMYNNRTGVKADGRAD